MQNIQIHFKMYVDHGITAQITDFILWIIPKHISSFCKKCGFNSAPSTRPLGLTFSFSYSVFKNKKSTFWANHPHLEEMLTALRLPPPRLLLTV